MSGKDVKGIKDVKTHAGRLTLSAVLIVFTSLTLFTSMVISRASAFQKTTKDKIYSKDQATRGAALYVKFCERCHNPEKVPADKKPGPPTVGPKFLETWQDRTLGELFATIFTTMPSDGSATLTTDQTLDVVAHMLQLNGFPEGPAPLKNDDAMKTAIIVK